MKNLKERLLKIYDVNKLTFYIKQKYEKGSKNLADKIFMLIITFYVIILYPMMSIISKIEMKIIKKRRNVYTLSKYKDVKFYIPDMETDIMQGYFWRANDFHDADILPGLVKKYIPKNAVVLDIGGNVGNHTVYFGKFTRGG